MRPTDYAHAFAVAAAVCVAGFAAACRAGEESDCSAALHAAPSNISQLDAVRDCRDISQTGSCGYMQTSAGYDVLTLVCPPLGTFQVLAPERLASLEFDEDELIGTCWEGRWERGLGLVGCFPLTTRAAQLPLSRVAERRSD